MAHSREEFWVRLPAAWTVAGKITAASNKIMSNAGKSLYIDLILYSLPLQYSDSILKHFNDKQPIAG